MPPRDSEIDANFYRLVHELVGSRMEDEPAERRRGERHPFAVDQWIAPSEGPAFPVDSRFFKVRCQDLNQGGFAFLLPQMPDFDRLVAAFGQPPNLTYLAAEVRHCHRVLVSSSGEVHHVGDQAAQPDTQGPAGDAQPMIMVGCRFTRRLYKPT